MDLPSGANTNEAMCRIRNWSLSAFARVELELVDPSSLPVAASQGPTALNGLAASVVPSGENAIDPNGPPSDDSTRRSSLKVVGSRRTIAILYPGGDGLASTDAIIVPSGENRTYCRRPSAKCPSR